MIRLGLHLQVLSIELRKVFSYRAEFWLHFWGVVLSELGIAYFLWRAVYEYRGAEALGGYTFHQMMFYFLLVPLSSRIVKGKEMDQFASEIYDGSLTRYLVYPLPFFGYKYMAQLALGIIGIFEFTVGMGLFALLFRSSLGGQMDWGHLSAAALTAVLMSVLYFLMSGAIEMVAFWADNVWTLLVMLRFTSRLLGGGLIPLSLFPEWSRGVLEFLPFSLVISFPAQIGMGRVSLAEWLHSMGMWAIWVGIFAWMCRVIWLRGTRQYTGVGI